MTPEHPAVPWRGSGGHHPKAVPVFTHHYTEFRAVCSCGWYRAELNTKRENAVRAARRHAKEADQ